MEEKKKEWQLPKNVKQIGETNAEKRIYIEDYVMTFIEKISADGKSGKAILLGEQRQIEGKTYIFADSALQVETFYMEHEAKETLKEEARRYFGEKRVVGWFQLSEENMFVVDPGTREIFEREFSEENQILVMREREEGKTELFLMQQGEITKQEGYFVYFEKNTAMQEYMISGNEGKSVEAESPVKDDVMKRFRKIISEKKQIQKETQEKQKISWDGRNGRLFYLAGGFLVVTVLTLGGTMVYNYDKIKEVQNSLTKLTQNVESQSQYLKEEPMAAQVMLQVDEKMEETESKTAESEEAGLKEIESEQETRLETELETETIVLTEKIETSQASAPGRASYTVKVGDTLAGISEMYYGDTGQVAEICSLNGIDDQDTILPGQKILLP